MPQNDKKTVSIQYSSVLLSTGIQKKIKTQLIDVSDKFNKTNTEKTIKLNAILNNNSASLDLLLKANPDLDIVFTNFQLHAASTHKKIEDAKEGKRFPIYNEWTKVVQSDAFIAKQLILTGNLPDLLHHYLKNKVSLTFFNQKEPDIPITIQNPDELYIQLDKDSPPLYPASPGAKRKEDPIILTELDSIVVDQLVFSGCLHIAADDTIFDKTLNLLVYKMLLLESKKNQLVLKHQRNENRHLIDTKRVFICLDDPFNSMIKASFSFVGIKYIESYTSLEDAEAELKQGSLMLLAYALKETEYAAVFTVLDASERENFFFHLLSDSELLQSFAEEYKASGSYLAQMEDSMFSNLTTSMPKEVLHYLIQHIANKFKEKFFIQVPVEERANFFAHFVVKKQIAKEILDKLDSSMLTELINKIATEIASFVFLYNNALFKQWFPENVEVLEAADSDDFLKLTKQKKQEKYKAKLEEFKQNKNNFFDLKKISQEEIRPVLLEFMQLNTKLFYNMFSPEFRKEIWIDKVQDRIPLLLSVLKLEEIRALILLYRQVFFDLFDQLRTNIEKHITRSEYKNLLVHIFIILKQFSNQSTKTQFFKEQAIKLTNDSQNNSQVLDFLKLPSSQEIVKKLYTTVNLKDFTYFLLVCFSKDLEILQSYGSLKNALPIVIDHIVQPDLIHTLNPPIMDPDIEQCNVEESLIEHIKKLEAELAKLGKNKPIDTYLLESNLICMKATLSIVRGEFSKSTIDELDARNEIKKEFLTPLLKTIKKLQEVILAEKKQLESLLNRKNQIMESFAQVFKLYHDYMEKLKKYIVYKTEQRKQLELIIEAKKSLHKSVTTLKQKFSDIITPILKEQLQESLLHKAFLKTQKLSFFSQKQPTRWIFPFRDKDLSWLGKRQLVFICSNKWTKFMVITFLKVEKVEEFVLVVEQAQEVWKESKLIFIDTGIDKSEITSQVDHQHVYTFCDEDSYQLFTSFARREMKILGEYTKVQKKYTEYSNFIDQSNKKAAPLLQQQEVGHRAVHDISAKYKSVSTSFKKNKYAFKRVKTNYISLVDAFKNIDAAFIQIKNRLSESAIEFDKNTNVAQVSNTLKSSLQEGFLSLSKTIGDVSFFRVVNEANKLIVDYTIERSIEALHKTSLYQGKKENIKNILIVYEEAVATRAILTGLGPALEQFFGKSIKTEQVLYRRFKAKMTADEYKVECAIFLIDRSLDNYTEISQDLIEFDTKNQSTYMITILPYILKNKHSTLSKNIISLRNYSYVVNSRLISLDSSDNIIDLLKTVFTQSASQEEAAKAQSEGKASEGQEAAKPEGEDKASEGQETAKPEGEDKASEGQETAKPEGEGKTSEGQEAPKAEGKASEGQEAAKPEGEASEGQEAAKPEGKASEGQKNNTDNN